ncbi:hypothetical protein [Amycolatopsis albispora]|uniref:Uncharacterized protein n=1 Tax=Amycolatopsis albispora TaxID=1804986 RepID=A0A344L9R0_9PSEU|nr:hypothetical protein [Amycolatopsis albispora]AXB44784.1 hypothetical protein A4R43_21660 [Amycolatopsis albispora]
MTLEHVELATLQVRDDPRMRARFAELTRPGGTPLEPADAYEARDSSGFVVVTVNKAAKVTNVRIRPGWVGQIGPAALPAALFNTYVTALQRALAVELIHRPKSTPRTPVPDSDSLDPAELSVDEFLARTRARSEATNRQYEAIRRQQQAPLAEIYEVRSPLGYLTLRMRGGGPLALHGDPRALDNPSAEALGEDALQLFARAGLGVASEARPAPEREPRGVSDGADDDYFAEFDVFDDED